MSVNVKSLFAEAVADAKKYALPHLAALAASALTVFNTDLTHSQTWLVAVVPQVAAAVVNWVRVHEPKVK